MIKTCFKHDKKIGCPRKCKRRTPENNERIFLVREYYHKNIKNKSVYRIVYRIVYKIQGKRFFSFPKIKTKTFAI